MTDSSAASEERRTPNGLYYRVVGRGMPLLLLHGLMASGRMFDPLVELLRGDFRMLIPDLRGHGQSRDIGRTTGGPYDPAAMAGDLDAMMTEADFGRGLVLGYSHGGAVAQALARAKPDAVSQLLLTCTYARNTATLREYLEGLVLVGLLSFVTPPTLARLVVQPGRASMPGMTSERAAWLREIMGANGRKEMREAAKGLLSFDSRPWLKDIAVPSFVIAGQQDTAVPAHHFDTLMFGIPHATGTVVLGAGHTLLWTHTAQLAVLIRERARHA
jgi:3-oxoadipate enol-lactonase